MTPCEKSTVLFPYFAEWFVDGFLRSERPHPDPETGEPVRDPARNESNHEIDLIQIYGLNDGRDRRSCGRSRAGCCRRQMINGEEYPPYLYDGERKRFDRVTVVRAEQITPDQRRQLFAFGSDTGNLQIGFVLMGVLFVREHNRIARSLGGLPRLGRRAAVPDGAQHPHGDPHQDRCRGVHQPHLAVPPQAARRPDRLPQPALVPAELDVDRVQPALPLAQPGPLELPDRRPGRRRQGHAVQHRQRRRARPGRLLRGRLESACGARRPLQLAPRGLGGRDRQRAPGARA